MSTRQLLCFLYSFCRRQWALIAGTALLLTLACVISALIPMSAKELASFNTPQSGAAGNATDRGPTGDADNTTAKSATDAMGRLSVRLFTPLLESLRFLRGGGAPLSPFTAQLTCRALLTGSLVVGYHAVSLLAHLCAYRAGMATRTALMEESVRQVLATPNPERVAVVNSVALTTLVSSSGKECGDVLAALLTDVLASVISAVYLLVIMLYISVPLTLSIAVMVLLVQLIYLYAGRHQDQRGSRVADEESNVVAYVANAMHRSETVFVFGSQEFILRRLRQKLGRLTRLTDQLNLSIHGFAALSSGSTNLILVVVVSVANYLHRHGKLQLMDMALFVIYLQSLFGALLRLAQEASKMRVALGRLQTLKSTLEWYAAPPPARDTYAPPMQLVRLDDPEAQRQRAVALEGVTFQYPEVPSFLRKLMMEHKNAEAELEQGSGGTAEPNSEDATTQRQRHPKGSKGITDVTFAAPPASITVLYGPSGSGKSTCLRLLCGLARPLAGTVTTHAHPVLLEQQHAIFMGSVAENILLAAAETQDTEKDKARVETAATKSGCASFLRDPFNTYIHNVAQPPFSGGQLQRLCLARVFASREKECTLVLLDEPTTGLDDAATRLLLATIKELRDVYHKTVIISSHDERVREIADKVVELGGP